MPKGQDQVTEAARLCRAMAAEVDCLAAADERTEARTRLEGLAGRLEALAGKFFVKMAPALRYTGACLAAAAEARAALVPGAPAAPLTEKLAALEAAVATLEGRASAPGSVTIT